MKSARRCACRRQRFRGGPFSRPQTGCPPGSRTDFPCPRRSAELCREKPFFLAVALRRMTLALVIGIAAVADGDIKIAIQSEGDAASIVVEIRLVDLQQHPLGFR